MLLIPLSSQQSLSFLITIAYTILCYKLLRGTHFRIVWQHVFFSRTSGLRTSCFLPLLLSAFLTPTSGLLPPLSSCLPYHICTATSLCEPWKWSRWTLHTHAHEKNPATPRFFQLFFLIWLNKDLQIAVLVHYGGPAKWVTRMMGWAGCVKPLVKKMYCVITSCVSFSGTSHVSQNWNLYCLHTRRS